MILTIIVFFIVLGVLVFVHELGHFYSARKLGVGVEEFGFGFPPKIFGIKKNGVMYSLNLIPIGGFVKIKGESGDNEDDSDSFINAPIWKRIIILSAGVFMNFVLAFVLLSVGFGIGIPSSLGGDYGDAKIRDQKIQVISVYPGSPAYKSGIKLGDYIVSLDDKTFSTSEELTNYIELNQEKEILVKVNSVNDEKTLTLKPEQIDNSLNKKIIGVSLSDTGIVSYPWYKAPLYGFRATINLTGAIFKALIDLIAGLFSGHGAEDVSGPIGVAVFTGRAVSMGWQYILQFMAILSVNLAIINILPFPALDGGRIMFLIIEKIRRKKNNQKLEAIIHNIGFSFLMLLIVLVTFKDIRTYGGKMISGIKNIF